MKKTNVLKQMLNVTLRIVATFIIIFIFYLLSDVIDLLAYNYFVFPTISIILVFLCGISVGRILEQMRRNARAAYLIKNHWKDEETEFKIVAEKPILSNKTIIEEKQDGSIYIKTRSEDYKYEEEVLTGSNNENVNSNE